MSRLQTLLAALLLPVTVLAAAIPPAGSFAGVPVANAESSDLLSNSYIVVYNNTFGDEAIDHCESQVMDFVKRRNIGKRGLHGKLLSTDVHALAINGLRAMSFESDDEMIMDIMTHSEVEFVEANANVHLFETVAQTNAPAGLRRLSSAGTDDERYVFDTSAGEDIVVYVVDTGIMTEHTEFQGRASFGVNTVDNFDGDDNGHGTHVAGTIAGQTFGVAKSAEVVGVRVLNGAGAGSNAGVLDGMQWIINDVQRRNLRGKAVMNMSLGGPPSQAVNRAIQALHDAGIVPVVAAGNENQDAGNVSPASSPDAITVGAIDPRDDRRAEFSNFGRSVDIFAAGVDVLSAGVSSNSATDVLSGTSMASPHVAGLAAYIMALEGISDPDDVASRLVELAENSPAEVRGNAPGTTRLIANNGNL